MSPINITILSLTLVSVLYLASVVGYSLAQRPGMALAFFGYVIANIGLIWDAIQVAKGP